MKNSNEIMEVALPSAEAAEITVKAAQAGVPTQEFIGIHALAGFYGHLHPLVVAFRNRAKPGINGPKTQEDEKA